MQEQDRPTFAAFVISHAPSQYIDGLFRERLFGHGRAPSNNDRPAGTVRACRAITLGAIRLDLILRGNRLFSFATARPPGGEARKTVWRTRRQQKISRSP